MPAFNRRIRPKEYFGVSAVAFICFMCGFIFTAFSFLPFLVCHIVFPVLAMGAYVLTVLSFLKHKDSLFLTVIAESKKDLKCRPKEAMEEW